MATSIFILTGVALGLWAWVLVVPVVVIRVRSLHVRGALGLALPGFILMTGAGWSEGVLRHELEHQRQMRRYSGNWFSTAGFRHSGRFGHRVPWNGRPTRP